MKSYGAEVKSFLPCSLIEILAIAFDRSETLIHARRLDNGAHIRNSRLATKLRRRERRGRGVARMSDDGRLGGWRPRGWPAAHFLRYSGCKFHMRIPFSARFEPAYTYLCAESNAVTAVGAGSFQ